MRKITFTLIFIVTVTSQLFSTSPPDWAKDAVWYQIFPGRFRNGDPANDPTLESIKGAFPHDTTSPWKIHRWTSDWYELQPYEKKSRKDIWFNKIGRASCRERV